MKMVSWKALYASVARLTDFKSHYKRFLDAGIIMPDPHTIYISMATIKSIKVGAGTILCPQIVLLGSITIGKNCIISPFTTLYNVKTGDWAIIGRPHIFDATLGNNVRIGAFTEVVRTRIDDRSSAQHFSYIGDAEVGKDVNIGAGFVTGNFDGEKKNKTVIEDGAFVGIQSGTVAPVTIGREAMLAAQALATKDVPTHTMIINVNKRLEDRTWHKTKTGWKQKKNVDKNT